MSGSKLHVGVMRSQLGRVRGLGSAKKGSGEWWTQRLNSIALVPLTLWFVISIIRLAGLPHAAMVHWAGQPVNSVLLICLVLATFQHMALGLQVVIEDYIHEEKVKLVSLLAMKGVTALLALASAMAVLKLAF
jgi:succinate dehydrogenase / fumarate reductase membrane anchor subunit